MNYVEIAVLRKQFENMGLGDFLIVFENPD